MVPGVNNEGHRGIRSQIGYVSAIRSSYWLGFGRRWPGPRRPSRRVKPLIAMACCTSRPASAGPADIAEKVIVGTRGQPSLILS